MSDTPNAELVEMVARAQWEARRARGGELGPDFPLLTYDELGERKITELTDDATAVLIAITPVIRRQAIEGAAQKAHDEWMDGTPVAEIPAAIRAMAKD